MKNFKNLNLTETPTPKNQKIIEFGSDEYGELLTQTPQYDQECYLEKIAEEQYNTYDLGYIDCWTLEESMSFYNH